MPGSRKLVPHGPLRRAQQAALPAANLSARHGRGNLVLMKDISAPIFVGNRHRGSFRMGVKVRSTQKPGLAHYCSRPTVRTSGHGAPSMAAREVAPVQSSSPHTGPSLPDMP